MYRYDDACAHNEAAATGLLYGSLDWPWSWYDCFMVAQTVHSSMRAINFYSIHIPNKVPETLLHVKNIYV